MKLDPKKVFKEKKTVKGELEKALASNTKITHSYIAKAVGISVHRVKKYCKNHNIDINNYSPQTLSQTIVHTTTKSEAKSEEKKEKKKKKMVLEQKSFNKIDLGQIVDIKYKI